MNKRKIVYILIFVLIFGMFLYVSRGPNVSNVLKKLILPELELATGKKFIAQKIYINVVPLFIEIKGMKVFDDNGTRIVELDRVKGYIGLSGLLSKEIVVKRLVIKGAGVRTSREQVEEIVTNIKRYLAEEQKSAFKVKVKSIDLVDSSISFQDNEYQIALEEFDALVVLSDVPRFRLASKKAVLKKKDLPELTTSFDTTFFVKDSLVDLKSFKAEAFKSTVALSGTLESKGLLGRFTSDIKLRIESLRKIFGLRNSGEGALTAKGTIRFDGLKRGLGDVVVDVAVQGDLFLETLMELLKVTEPLKGHITINGTMKGPLTNLIAEGRADLKKGNIFNVDVDRLLCTVSYRGGVMRLSEGRAVLYGGTATAEAAIPLPVVDRYSLKVTVKEVHSKEVFKLIGWDPGIPAGRVSGEITSEGSAFNPFGSFFYRSVPKGRDILDRVREVKGAFAMRDDVLHFEHLTISTEASQVAATGDVDIKNSTLHIAGNGTASDMIELTSPYVTALSGPVRFSSTISGNLDDPVLDMKFSSAGMTLKTGRLGISDVVYDRNIRFDTVEGAVTYRKNLLNLKSLTAHSSSEEYRGSGVIRFPRAAALFDMKRPDYDLSLSARQIDLERLTALFQGSPRLSGTMHAEFKLYGAPNDIRMTGGFQGSNVIFDDTYAVEDVAGSAAYKDKGFTFTSVRLRNRNSVLHAQGRITTDKVFSLEASGQKVSIADVLPAKIRRRIEEKYKELSRENVFDTIVLTKVSVKGEGTFTHPSLEFAGDVQGGAYRGHSFGRGSIAGSLKGKYLKVNSSLLDRKMGIAAEAHLAGTFPWKAAIDLQPARYDFIIASFLKDVPDDLLLSLRGSIKAHGDRENVNALITLNKAHLYAYGTGFTNATPIVARLEDKRLSIGTLTMKSDVTEFKVSGGMVIGKSYDLLLEGASSLAPLKALSKTLDVLKGNATFVVSVAGNWERPKVNGALDITNGTLGIKNIHYRLSSLSAYVYIDEDRVVLERAQGKLSGGDVSLFGTAYLQKFSIKRFFIESRLKNITASLSKDLWTNFDGTLYYRGDTNAQTILGDIALRRARYTGRVEWKSWLLKARQRERIRTEPTRFDATALNVRVVSPNLIIDNNVARAGLRTDMLIRGTIGRPVLLGKIEAKEGVVYFRNNEFKILKGNIDFSNPNQIRPYFDVVAETRARNYNIRLSLEGYAEQFNLSLASDPPLSETDIFSLLTVGQVGKSLQGLEGGIGAGEATSFLTGKLQDVIEERLKTVTGFDRVQVDPSVSKTTGTVAPRVTIAKRLLGDKLYVTYSAAVGSGEEQIWKLEYQVGKNTSLVGVRDERGGLGGDIKFRFEFK
ncbi:MAG: translocation/assembly module TamB domain-containing protein [Nitrospirota bacterium]